ncbi:cation-translocating P-type ATPase [Methanobrevibacter sp. OttesenSCG-928-K11]|nr:cation-translocating P-type ATPase [Methanobrevibacter sp. OttesenSCG-928-K11]MDL2270501.1 cation-translocating P-type ATPase [Methanobrevibacter sp. OttesenSCG-928-I08]
MKISFNEEKRDLLFIIISAICLILSFLNIKLYFIDLAWIAIILCGLPIIKEAIIGLITEFDIKADVLVAMALIASIIIGEVFAAGEIAVIMAIGGLLEEYTVNKSRSGIEKIVDLTPQIAKIIKGNKEEEIYAKDVKTDDIVKVLPGEIIPVDGIIIEGETSIDQSVMTGEPLPYDKTVNDKVYSGTLNQLGSIIIKATKSGENSSFQRLVKLVESADAKKSKIVRQTDKWATWIVVIALTSAIITYFLTGEIIRSVTILVVFCPCALVLATPTAIVASHGNLTKLGILVKEGDALERLSQVKKIVFDKTGTLTYGKPEFIDLITYGAFDKDKLLLKISSLENMSEHPLGKAIVRYFIKNYEKEFLNVSNFKMEIGRGVKGEINNEIILAGNLEFLKENNIEVNDEWVKDNVENLVQKGFIAIFTSINGEFSGIVILNDVLREDSKELVSSIKNIGIKPLLVTGDSEKPAKHISNELGIDDVFYNCLPEKKLEIINSYQNKGENLAMLGDGINDAASIKEAFVGMVMGKIGNDITIDVADIVFVNDDIRHISHLLKLSHKTMKTININITVSLALNFIAIILAMFGILNPITGALVHNIGSVLVIIYSAMLLNWKG